MNFDNTYVCIDLDAIHDNMQAVRQKAGVPVMAVVKALRSRRCSGGPVPAGRLRLFRCQLCSRGAGTASGRPEPPHSDSGPYSGGGFFPGHSAGDPSGDFPLGRRSCSV